MPTIADHDLPEAFKQFAQSMYLPGAERAGASDKMLMQNGLQAVRTAEREGLKIFLNKLLDGTYSDKDINYIWYRQRPIFFLTMVDCVNS